METPVVFIIFNRPDCCERVLDAIRRAKPKQLFVVADGPRSDQSRDIETCAATRAVIERVDWDCEVLKNYSDINMGVGRRPATGITWAFEQVERAIILEDDCLPHPTFFRFCEELLDRYADDERVMQISGTSPFPTYDHPPYSYYFSYSFLVWGWATWARAWKHYDSRLSSWPERRHTPWLSELLVDRRPIQFYQERFQKIYESAHSGRGHQHPWDWPWLFSVWARRGLDIGPYHNLIENIGFQADATNTKDDARLIRLFGIPATGTDFPLRHPPHVVRTWEADDFFLKKFWAWMGPKIRRRRYHLFYHRIRRFNGVIRRRMASVLPTRRPAAGRRGSVLMAKKQCPLGATIYPGAHWARISPTEAGFDPERFARIKRWLDDRVENGRYRVVIVRGGRLVAEWNCGIHRGAQLQLASATKSIFSCLLGIAIEEGKLASADAKIVDYYPEAMDVPEGEGPKPGRYALAKDHAMTFRQLISNTSGYMKLGEEPGKVFHY